MLRVAFGACRLTAWGTQRGSRGTCTCGPSMCASDHDDNSQACVPNRDTDLQHDTRESVAKRARRSMTAGHSGAGQDGRKRLQVLAKGLPRGRRRRAVRAGRTCACTAATLADIGFCRRASRGRAPRAGRARAARAAGVAGRKPLGAPAVRGDRAAAGGLFQKVGRARQGFAEVLEKGGVRRAQVERALRAPQAWLDTYPWARPLFAGVALLLAGSFALSTVRVVQRYNSPRAKRARTVDLNKVGCFSDC